MEKMAHVSNLFCISSIHVLYTYENPIKRGKDPSNNMRNRDPHRENLENILAICLPIMTM